MGIRGTFDALGCGEYGGCGRAWAAIDGGRVVAIRYMGKSRAWFGGEPEVLARAKRKRLCDHSRRVAETMSTEAFLEWRKRARAELAELGAVVSGVCSCGEFVVTGKGGE